MRLDPKRLELPVLIGALPHCLLAAAVLFAIAQATQPDLAPIAALTGLMIGFLAWRLLRSGDKARLRTHLRAQGAQQIRLRYLPEGHGEFGDRGRVFRAEYVKNDRRYEQFIEVQTLPGSIFTTEPKALSDPA